MTTATADSGAWSAPLSDTNLTKPGPYTAITTESFFSVEIWDHAGRLSPKQLPIFTTRPVGHTDAGIPATLQGCPVIVLFNGWQGKASWYTPFATRLATYGFVVVQYDAPATVVQYKWPFIRAVVDSLELKFWEPLQQWAAAANADPTSPLYGSMDLSQLCVAGHSRGGKLATLQLCNDPRVRAAYLLDPVDNTKQTPVGADYPSASAALVKAGKPIAIAGAGVIGPANPEGSNWKHFWSVAPSGSWLTKLPKAGHTNFMAAGLVGWAADRLMGGGKTNIQQVLEASSPAMLAWFSKQLRPATPAQQPAALPAEKPIAVHPPRAAVRDAIIMNFDDWVVSWSSLGYIEHQVKQ